MFLLVIIIIRLLLKEQLFHGRCRGPLQTQNGFRTVHRAGAGRLAGKRHQAGGAGYDYSVKFTDANDPDGDSKVYFNVAGDIAAADVTDGKGVGKDAIACLLYTSQDP